MQAGKRIGQYEITALIGRGGMGSVYRAWQPAVQREVAIKFLPEALAGDAQFRARFQQEATTIAKLEHPHILPLFDYGEQEGMPYLVMRLVQGGSLAERLARGGLSQADILRALEQTAAALDYAHARQVIHRDLKPANILLDADGHAYLSDFGIAKLLSAANSLTGSGIVGTPIYMAPEQIQGGAASPAMDIYALGVMAYELFVRGYPYTGDTYDLLLTKLKDPPRPPRAINPSVSPALEAVLLRALALRPEERYLTAGALAAGLRQALGAEARPLETVRESPARGPEAPALPPTVREGGTRLGPRRPAAAALMLAGLAVMVVACLGVLALGALALRGPALAWLAGPAATQAPMTGEFNIAIAEFSAGADGAGLPADAGQIVAEQVLARVETALSEALNGGEVLYQVAGPVAVGRVDGGTPEDRAISAAVLAARLNADIVVYGVLGEAGGAQTVQPAFYVSERAFVTAPELLGEHALGGPIQLAGTGDLASRVQVNRQVSDRVQALTFLAAGMETMALGDYAGAQALFSSAAGLEHWPDEAGKEIVYLLLGNATGRLEQMDAAEASFLKALALNPEYARAHVGLAGVYYRRALGVPPVSTFAEVDPALLDRAEAELEAALSAADRPASADVDVKVAFGRGQLALVRYQMTQAAEQLALAEEAFGAVAAVHAAGNTRVAEQAGLAHGYLGTVAFIQGDLARAEAEFRTAIETVVAPRAKAGFWAQLGDLYASQADTAQAIQAYEQAVENAPDDASRALYQGQLDELRAAADTEG
jgi:tetratricopeptide (TPR) repeat protein